MKVYHNFAIKSTSKCCFNRNNDGFYIKLYFIIIKFLIKLIRVHNSSFSGTLNSCPCEIIINQKGKMIFSIYHFRKIYQMLLRLSADFVAVV